MIGIEDALFSLYPDAQWVLRGNNYDEIEWNNNFPKPPWEIIFNEIQRLQKIQDDTEYQRLRAAEYPDFRDYLDGIVKNNQEQIQDYIDRCLAVKQKYPKSE